MPSRSTSALRTDLAGRFQRARGAVAAEAPGALDDLAAIALEALAFGDPPLAAASAGMAVLVEHMQWAIHRHAPRMLGVLAAVGPDAASPGAFGLLAWAGAALAHDYGVLPSWPRADLYMLMERARRAPVDVGLALGCALAEVCQNNGLDTDFSALRARLAGFGVHADASPLWRGYAAVACARFLYSFGRWGEALQELEAAQSLAATHGLIRLGAVAALQRAREIEWRRDPAMAVALTEQAVARGDPAHEPRWWADQADVRCCIALGASDFHAAVSHARLAVGYVQAAAGWPGYQVEYHANEAYALLGSGALDEAIACFRAIGEISMPRYQQERLECLISLAVLAVADQRGPWGATQQDGLAHLLRRLRELEWPTVFQLLPEHVARLYARALASGLEVDWVRAAIRTRKLPAPRGAPEGWPWVVVVRALGSFQVVTESGPLRPASAESGKASSKPLELLRHLAAHGLDALPVDGVAAALWPGDGREGRHKAFDVTVARLRRLLDSDAAITVRERHVRLNPQCVWVDVQALNDRLTEVEAAAPGSTAAATTLEAALELYRGPCLAGRDDAWAAAARQRLRARLAAALLRAMRGPAVSASKRGEWTLRATSADPQLGPSIGAA